MVLTVGDAFLDLRNELRLKGIAGYQIEARELICTALDIDREQFNSRRDNFVFDKDKQKIDELKQLRLSGTPIQHITGRWEFYGIDLKVTTDTLIPRADTETLVDCALSFLKQRDKGRVLDLCCGTGCVGIAVLKNVSDGINAIFADLSPEALAVTRENLRDHGLTGRALTVECDATKPPQDSMGKFNLVLCNPPYIPSGEIETLDKEVRCEPHMALDGGEDGLRFYRDIAKNYKRILSKGGAIMFEVGLSQYTAVADILAKTGYKHIKQHNDLAGIERVVVGHVD